MPKNITIPVRLDEDQIAKVRGFSQRFSVTDAQIVRWAIDAFIRYVELHDGDLRLPLDFSKFWPQVEASGKLAGLVYDPAAADQPDPKPSRKRKEA
jgi:hypothetical protein